MPADRPLRMPAIPRPAYPTVRMRDPGSGVGDRYGADSAPPMLPLGKWRAGADVGSGRRGRSSGQRRRRARPEHTHPPRPPGPRRACVRASSSRAGGRAPHAPPWAPRSRTRCLAPPRPPSAQARLGTAGRVVHGGHSGSAWPRLYGAGTAPVWLARSKVRARAEEAAREGAPQGCCGPPHLRGGENDSPSRLTPAGVSLT